MVRDYCAGMTMFGPPSFFTEDPMITIMEHEANSLTGMGLSPDAPWEYNLTKYLYSSNSEI